MVQARRGRASESVELFRKVAALQPASVEAHLNLGIALADSYDLEGALRSFSEAVRLAPNAAAARYNKGRALFDLHRYEEARTELNRAAELGPDQAPTLYSLALLERQLNNSQRAAELLQRVVALEPQNAVAHHLLAQNLSRLGRNAEAIQQWQKAVEIDPGHGEALYNLARGLQKEDPAKARLYQERFTALQQKRQMTDQAETLGNFGLASATARDWPQAVAHLKEALQVCGQCKSLGDIHKNLGLIYCQSGDLRNGEEQLRLALKIKPNDPDVLKALEVIASLAPKRTAGQ